MVSMQPTCAAVLLCVGCVIASRSRVTKRMPFDVSENTSDLSDSIAALSSMTARSGKKNPCESETGNRCADPINGVCGAGRCCSFPGGWCQDCAENGESTWPG